MLTTKQFSNFTSIKKIEKEKQWNWPITERTLCRHEIMQKEEQNFSSIVRVISQH